MKVSELTQQLQKVPQEWELLGVFVQRVGEMTPERQQEYKVRIVAENPLHKGAKTTVQFNYSSYVQEKKEQGTGLKQRPFASLARQ